jgi:16S rRNA (guanine527-N7)-methyltransferase
MNAVIPLSQYKSPLLTRYAALLREWNPKINLVSPKTLSELETRHIADSAQLMEYLPKASTTIADVGTGGGFPGLVLAILCPHHTFILIESDARKAAFLRTVVQELQLQNTTIKNQRVEDIELQPKASIVTARAFAPLERLLPQTQHLLAKNGAWLLLKGEAVDAELRVCETLFPMTVTIKPSKIMTNTEEGNSAAGVVVKLQRTQPT